MKKVLAFILLFVYLGTSTGATVRLHYCMGELAGWGLKDVPSETCGSCGMEKKDAKDNGCCKDEHKFVKGKEDQKTAEAAFQLMQVAATAVPVSFFELTHVHLPSIAEENPVSNAPPRSRAVAVYILHRTFLI